MAQGGYTKEMDRIIASLEGRPRLLLHACCAPCSSAVLELLDRHFELTIFYYNPNIAPDEEYHRREQELECFLEQAGYPQYAAENGFPWFTTTLSISPVKDPVRINSIGSEMAEKYGVSFLTSEFRKRDGYKRSLELSREYGLYRQDYCGCVFSRREREKGDR